SSRFDEGSSFTRGGHLPCPFARQPRQTTQGGSDPRLALTDSRTVPSHDVAPVRVAPGGMARSAEWDASAPRTRLPTAVSPFAPAVPGLPGALRRAGFLHPQAVWIQAVGEEPEDVRTLFREPGESRGDVPSG